MSASDAVVIFRVGTKGHFTEFKTTHIAATLSSLYNDLGAAGVHRARIKLDDRLALWTRHPQIMRLVVEYMEHYNGDSASVQVISPPLKSTSMTVCLRKLNQNRNWTRPWDAAFIDRCTALFAVNRNRPYEGLFDLCIAADYIGIPSLVSLVAAKLAAVIRAFEYGKDGPLSNLAYHFFPQTTKSEPSEYHADTDTAFTERHRQLGAIGLLEAGGHEFPPRVAEMVLCYAIVRERIFYSRGSGVAKILWNGRVAWKAAPVSYLRPVGARTVQPPPNLADVEDIYGADDMTHIPTRSLQETPKNPTPRCARFFLVVLSSNCVMY